MTLNKSNALLFSFAMGLSLFAGGAFAQTTDPTDPPVTVGVGIIQPSGSDGSSTGVGNHVTIGDTGNTCVGYMCTSIGLQSTGNGFQNTASGNLASSYGAFGQAAESGSSFGAYSVAAQSAAVLGEQANGAMFSTITGAQAQGDAYSVVSGFQAKGATQDVVLGYMAQGLVGGCNAIGSGASCNEAQTTSFGNFALTSRLVNVSPGINYTDAAVVGQIMPVAQFFGGGASFVGGVWNGPSYVFKSGDIFNDVGSALLNLDGRVYTLENAPPSGGGTPGPVGPTGPTGPAGPQGPSGTNGTNGTNGKDGTGGSDPLAVKYDDASKTKITLGATTTTTTDSFGDTATATTVGGPVTITNVADGAVTSTSSDAVNGSQLYQSSAADRSYTDQQVTKGVQQSEDWAKAYTDQKFSQVKGLIDGSLAMGQAQSQASAVASSSYKSNRWGVAPGFSGNRQALAAQYIHVADNGLSFSVGAAFSRGQSSVGFGIGGGW